MRFVPRSLRGLTIAFLALFFLVTTSAGLGTFFATRSTINALVDRRVEFESHEIAPLEGEVGREELHRRIDDLTGRRDTADLGILLTDRQGRMIAGNTRFTRKLPLGFSSLDDADSIEGLSAGRAFVREIPGGMRLAVFAETEPIDDYRSARQLIYILGFGAIVVVVLTGLLLFRGLVGRRIDEMRRTAESIIDGDLATRVPVAGDGGEFDQQAAAFNRMLDRIGVLMAEIRNVTNDISHEMRTPLARLRNALALLERHEDAGLLRAELETAREQADTLLGMFAAMLRIAEIESGSRRAGFAPIEPDVLVDEVVEIVRPLAQERGQAIVIERRDTVRLVGDRQLLSQLLVNLMENAAMHTPPGTTIRVAVERQARAVMLMVADDGPGIAADQRKLVMRRFGRLDRGEGYGLGLPLADAIARLHGGTLVLEDAAPGLRIRVTLPV
ncbi:HAMP domain-containing sensor histidine kinase [Novosphingobium resinovorum]|uniref:sensor histidine kinase n=1 Tax=Novosphingobium resinovorum TaxID=158500 RepID=UPI002ED5B774|nr:HAMP domain-containing sensor histidine kinase [Novosphingobium resinovorum]